MKLTFHGAANEVGRSCIELQMDGKRVLLDAGLKLTQAGSEYPVGMKDLQDVHSAFISHAHLDHTGALPLFDHERLGCPVFMTPATKILSKMLLKDAFMIGKISHEHLRYGVHNIKDVINCIRKVEELEKGEFEGVSYEFFDAGHIPGSTSILLRAGNKNLLYTGDINTTETELLNPADTSYKDVDVLICESTYGDREHPSREKEKQNFLSAVKETIDNKGSVLIPAFAVGRAQEVLLMLAQKQFDAPVYIDGMSIHATDAILEFPEYLKNAAKLKSVFGKAKQVHGWKHRGEVTKEQGIFITTSGMLTGGPVVDYLKHMWFEPKNSILLTGYQAEGTNGRMILEKGAVYLDGYQTKVKCNVRKYDFSAHSGQSDLKKLIKKLQPEKVFFNHGEEGSERTMLEWAKALDFDAYAPGINSTFNI